MKKSIYLLLTVVSLSMLSGCGKGEKTAENSLTIAGSTSVTPYAEKIARVFEEQNKDIKVDVQGLGSTAGVKATVENTADIGMVSREIKDEERELGLKEHIIAYEGIAVITNTDNKVNDLDMETIKKIFNGEIKNWKELGGEDETIIIVSREAGSGTRSAFDELIGLEKKHGDKKISTVSTDALVADGNGSMKQNIVGKKNAIGYISLGYVDKSVNTLKVEGIEPTAENIMSKSYMISRPFILVTNGEATGTAKEYLDLVMSKEGQAIIKEEGSVPVE